MRVFFKLMTDLGGPSHCGWVTPGLVVLVSTTKEAEQVMGSKAVKWYSSMALCQLLHSGFYPIFFKDGLLPGSVRQTKPFPSQIVLVIGIYHSNGNPSYDTHILCGYEEWKAKPRVSQKDTIDDLQHRIYENVGL